MENEATLIGDMRRAAATGDLERAAALCGLLLAAPGGGDPQRHLDAAQIYQALGRQGEAARCRRLAAALGARE